MPLKSFSKFHGPRVTYLRHEILCTLNIRSALACDFYADGAVDDTNDKVDFVFFVLSHCR